MSFADRIRANRAIAAAKAKAEHDDRISRLQDPTRPEYVAAYKKVKDICVNKHTKVEKASLDSTVCMLYNGNHLDVLFLLDDKPRRELLQKLMNEIAEAYENVVRVHFDDDVYGRDGKTHFRIYIDFVV